MTEITTIDLIFRLTLAIVLGAMLGTERIIAHKVAGLRTHALISMGAALSIIISETVTRNYIGMGVLGTRPTYVLAQIVTAIGFLTAGIFFRHDNHVSGLTTASGLWLTAGIGAAIGYGFFTIGITAAVLSFIVFTVFWRIEQKVVSVSERKINKKED